MPRTAPAPAFRGTGRIDVVDRTYPDPGPGRLLLRVEANAICGTDRGAFRDGSAVVPGHEAAGVVAEAGPGTRTPVGTRGVVYLMDFCGRCRGCALGHTNQCEAKRADMGFTADGGYGPYELVSESIFYPVPDSLPAADATLLLDVMGTSGHALSRIAAVRPDVESLLVCGAGPIGLGTLVMARLRLGDDVPVHVSDLSPWRRELAGRLGGIPVDPNGPLPTADAAIDSTGSAGARAAALRALGKRGVLVCVGHGGGLSLDVSPDLIAPERAVLGSEYFRFDELASNLDLLLAHRERITAVTTHRFPVTEIDAAFAAFLGGRTGKVVVTQDGAR